MRMRLLLAGAILLCQGVSYAQVVERVPANGPQLGDPITKRYQVGCIVRASAGPCIGIVATVPVPMEWPEQVVQVIEEDKSQFVKTFKYNVLDNGVRQLQISIPQLPAGAEAKALVTLEITRHTITAPKDTTIFSIPTKVAREINIYLGDSPFIESRNAKIIATAKEIAAEKETAWEKVEAIYDWVRANVQYKEGKLKGGLAAMRDGDGDCEDMSSLFIAMCRACKVPARTVWVPGHCYPEFYLVDKEGQGHWIPCQAAGTRAFGEIPETRPILQKGDNFKVPERPNDRQRYVAEFLTGKGGKPSVQFVRKTLDE